MTSSQNSKIRHLQHIDSLRGIAILMVIGIHSYLAVNGVSKAFGVLCSYGQMGVQLFFVASAYTLCLSHDKRSSEDKALLKYGVRRFFRIAPIYYLGIIFYFFIFTLAEWYKTGKLQVLERYTFVNVFVNFTFLNGFYPPGNNNIVPGGWSIGTEVAFYFCFPVIFMLLKRININSKAKFLSVVLLPLILSQALLLIIFLVTNNMVINNNFLYFNLVNQFPVFCIGIIFYLYEKYDAKSTSLVNISGFVVMTLVSLLLWISDLPWVFSLIPFFSGLSFVFLFKIFRDNECLNSKLLMRIGRISYSIYLFHFAFTKVFKIFTPKISDFIGPELTVVVTFLTVTVMTFIIALISERLIEKYFIKLGKNVIENLEKYKIEEAKTNRLYENIDNSTGDRSLSD